MGDICLRDSPILPIYPRIFLCMQNIPEKFHTCCNLESDLTLIYLHALQRKLQHLYVNDKKRLHAEKHMVIRWQRRLIDLSLIFLLYGIATELLMNIH